MLAGLWVSEHSSANPHLDPLPSRFSCLSLSEEKLQIMPDFPVDFFATWLYIQGGGFPVPQTVKSLPAMWETWVWPLSQEDSLEKEMATHSSILAWMDGVAHWAIVHGVAKSRTQLSYFRILISKESRRIPWNSNFLSDIKKNASNSTVVSKMIDGKTFSLLMKLNKKPWCPLMSTLGTAGVLLSRSVTSDFLWPHGLQHARPPCPSPSPGVCSS